MAYLMARIPLTLSELEGHLLLQVTKCIVRYLCICGDSCHYNFQFEYASILPEGTDSMPTSSEL